MTLADTAPTILCTKSDFPANNGREFIEHRTENFRRTAFARQPQRVWRVERDEAGDIQIFSPGRQKHGVAVIQKLAKTKAASVHGGTVDGGSGQGACGQNYGAGLAPAGDGDRRGIRRRAVFGRAKKGDDGQHIVHALREKRVIVAIGVAGEFARI